MVFAMPHLWVRVIESGPNWPLLSRWHEHRDTGVGCQADHFSCVVRSNSMILEFELLGGALALSHEPGPESPINARLNSDSSVWPWCTRSPMNSCHGCSAWFSMSNLWISFAVQCVIHFWLRCLDLNSWFYIDGCFQFDSIDLLNSSMHAWTSNLFVCYEFSRRLLNSWFASLCATCFYLRTWPPMHESFLCMGLKCWCALVYVGVFGKQFALDISFSFTLWFTILFGCDWYS